MKNVLLVAALLLQSSVSGFVAPVSQRSSLGKKAFVSARAVQMEENEDAVTTVEASQDNSKASFAAAAPAAVALFTALPAEAAGPVPEALVAYSHYLFLLIGMGLLVFERVTVKAGMSKEDEKSLVFADASYGINGALLAASGYFRVVEYGKGWEFYSHEPLFWLKIAFAGVLAGLSAFPTIIITQRGFKIFKDLPLEPMSEELAKRMHSVINAEISAILSIPVLATLMARGVGYMEDFPWQAGAGLVAVSLVGSGFLYGKKALSWKEPEVVSTESE